MKNFYIYILVLLGVFLMPNSAMACGNTQSNAPKKECAKEKMASKDAEKMDCCSKKSKEDKKGCDGKCGHSKCSTSSVQTIAFLAFDATIPFNCFDFSVQKLKIDQAVGFLSDGYSSLWLIPKIG
ncbi:hypothetical protein FFWV33_01595 [Flavobacterium faecale]|uniref:Uncharacterized protein n=1 Tax=Flavobacterium faecale TaxID=1355330 RepID=A0A2S1L9E3_9FLAO|nr:hypothetical protein [Flavobacterium faecale]AWG20308.1 hypothetical protein FFWV33_01595 [Flavobacterium faecale]